MLRIAPLALPFKNNLDKTKDFNMDKTTCFTLNVIYHDNDLSKISFLSGIRPFKRDLN